MYKVLGADLHCPMFSLAFLKSQPSDLLAILLQFFSLQQFFSFPMASYIKKPKATSKSLKQKPKAKSLMFSFSESFISSGKQGGAAG
jgi:hypothetical protein